MLADRANEAGRVDIGRGRRPGVACYDALGLHACRLTLAQLDLMGAVAAEVIDAPVRTKTFP